MCCMMQIDYVHCMSWFVDSVSELSFIAAEKCGIEIKC
jgi:hypothetical protein